MKERGENTTIRRIGIGDRADVSSEWVPMDGLTDFRMMGQFDAVLFKKPIVKKEKIPSRLEELARDD